MPEKTKREKINPQNVQRKEAEKPCAENEAIGERESWSHDQKEKSYYYDDAYGYEIYNPEEEDDETGSDK